jgi:tetratricopeptide (TPR) repeat protein
MLERHAVWTAVLLAFFAGPATAADGCTMVRSPDIHVTMHGLAPVISVKINGTAEPLILDSGADFSTLAFHTADGLNLPQYRANYYSVGATGGMSELYIATAKTFTFTNAEFHNVEFQVVPGLFGQGAVGLLGENMLRLADVEYDLANGIVRLMRPINCGDRPLAYWATTQPVSVVDLQSATAVHPLLIGHIQLNGRTIRALFDTGGLHSVVSLHAAESAGVTPESSGVTPAGTISGIGGKPVHVWSAPFASIDIGGEKILHTHVLIGHIEDYGFDMIIGADFFLAHRVYTDNSRNKLYFTYNGGPVFNLNTISANPPPTASSPPAAGLASPAAQPSSGATAPASEMPSNQPTDGEGYMRRAMAYEARNDFVNALADLNLACKLAPRDPQVFYARALLYRHYSQSAPALQDLDQAVTLDPGDLDARAARAALRLPDRPTVEADLAAINRLAASGADVRLTAARDYAAIGDYAAAVHQYDVWIASHDSETLSVTQPTWVSALSNRCRARGAAKVDLGRALSDCDKALYLSPKSPDTLDNRALVHLQRGDLEAAIRDYDASLELQPHSAEALYGRGLAEARHAQSAAARTDFGTAIAIEPAIAERFASFGLKP